jgi:hypothetical protein
MKNYNFVFLILLLIVVIFGATCNQGDDNVSDTGTIIYVDLEGGFYGIIADGGDRYLPDNLSQDFQEDNLRISFEGIITDQPNIAMWGRTISLTKIERIE